MAEQVYTVTKLEDDLLMIAERHVRMFLVLGETSALLVDTGVGDGDLAAFVKTLTDLPLTVVITHADGDHTGACGQFESVYMHPAEFDRYYSHAVETQALPVWEGDVLDVGGRAFEVIHIPGHTPGSIALLDRANRLMIGGDSLQEGPIFMFGPGRNMRALICSVKKLMKMDSAFDRILSSHNRLELGIDLLPALVEGAELQLSGTVEGVKPEMDRPCLQYNCGRVKFFCS